MARFGIRQQPLLQRHSNQISIRRLFAPSKRSFRLILICLAVVAIFPPIFFHFRLRRFHQMQLKKCGWLYGSPLVCAHGGDSTNEFPNSIAAYRSAIRSQVDCMEIDVSRSSDGVLFALHDRDLQGISGNSTSKVGHLSMKEIKELETSYQFAQKSHDQVITTIEDALMLVSNSVRQVILDAKVGPPSYEKGLAKDILSVVERTKCHNCLVWAKSDNLVRDIIRLSPNVTVLLFPDKYEDPIKLIVLWDTGASASILNPDVLPNEFWRPYEQSFRSASGDVFTTPIISKPLTVCFCAGLTLKHKFLRSLLSGKDMIIGWDLIQQLTAKQAFLTEKALKFKSFIQPYSAVKNMFTAVTTLEVVAYIIQDCCANSHSEFSTKCDHPLWLNPQFFISPFKKNEDINLTKATPPGMPPSQQKLAQEEIAQLQSQHLIETTKSEWAYQAFYVNVILKTCNAKVQGLFLAKWAFLRQDRLAGIHDIIRQRRMFNKLSEELSSNI